MGLTLAVDFGSTYTKLAAFDLGQERLVGTAHSRTTIEDDITNGLEAALKELRARVGPQADEVDEILACSSAAGPR